MPSDRKLTLDVTQISRSFILKKKGAWKDFSYPVYLLPRNVTEIFIDKACFTLRRKWNCRVIN